MKQKTKRKCKKRRCTRRMSGGADVLKTREEVFKVGELLSNPNVITQLEEEKKKAEEEEIPPMSSIWRKFIKKLYDKGFDIFDKGLDAATTGIDTYTEGLKAANSLSKIDPNQIIGPMVSNAAAGQLAGPMASNMSPLADQLSPLASDAASKLVPNVNQLASTLVRQSGGKKTHLLNESNIIGGRIEESIRNFLG